MRYILLAMACVLMGCRGIGKNQNNLFTQAEAIRENTETIRTDAREIMVQSEVIAQNVQINDDAIRAVLEAGVASDRPEVAEPLSKALDANAGILEARAVVSTKAHAINTTATSISQSADEVTHSARRVEDVPSFWERLSTSIRRLILIALGLVVIVVGWRFGLDKLVKSILNTVSTGINKASDWAYSKYQGPAKLIREGKTDEAIAALRATIPGLDKSFKRSDGNAG